MKRFPSGFARVCLAAACCFLPALAQETPPPEGEQTKPVKNAPPPAPKYPEARMPGERGLWVGGSAWFANPKPGMVKGTAPNPYPGAVQLNEKPRYDAALDFGIALGAHNSLQFSYFASQAHGSIIPSENLVLWDQFYGQGIYVDTDYRIKSATLTFEYLTWPYPVKTSRFRLKTLWQLHYTKARTGFDAPLEPLTDEAGNPFIDANGNLLTYAGFGSHSLLLPGVGVKAEEYISPKIRLEASVSGFALPHRSNFWNADATANFRVGHAEFQVGVRGYHFRTSPKEDYWIHGTMVGPLVGVRLYTD